MIITSVYAFRLDVVDTDDCANNDFVLCVVEPFDAENRDDAYSIIFEALKAKGWSKQIKS